MKRSAPFAKLGLAFLGLMLLLALIGFAVRFAGASWRKDELMLLTATNVPALPEDLRRPDDPRPEPTEWFGRLVSTPTRWEPTALARADEFARLAQEAEKNQHGGDALDAFAALEACAGTSANSAAAVQRVLDVLATHDGIVDVPPCGMEAVRVAALGTAAHVEIALLAHEYGPIDPAVIVASLTTTSATFPSLPIEQVMTLGAALQIELLKSLWSDRPERVPEFLRAQRDIARIFEGAPFLVGAFGVLDAERNLLGMLELALPRLEAGTDLAWLETELTALRPRARLAFAAAGERAFGNRAFELARSTGGSLGFTADSIVPASIRMSYDQGYFNRAWRQRIESLSVPAFQRAPIERPSWIDRRMAPISSALWSAPDAIIALADELEARLVLARAALVAFRTDAKGLLEFVQETSDPYDGRPIRVGFNADGLVLLWSVGPDGVDDGGVDDQKDIVWRYKAR